MNQVVGNKDDFLASLVNQNQKNLIAAVEDAAQKQNIRLKINSTSPFTPPETSGLPHVYAEHGRGLFLVDSVCEERITTEDGGILVRIKIQG